MDSVPDISTLSEGALKYREEFKGCLEDDLNTANAITVLFDLLKTDAVNNSEKISLIEDFDRVLSLSLLDGTAEDGVHTEMDEYIEEMIKKRQEAKKNKNYKEADAIREELLKKGIALEDTRQGVNWKKIN